VLPRRPDIRAGRWFIAWICFNLPQSGRSGVGLAWTQRDSAGLSRTRPFQKGRAVHGASPCERQPAPFPAERPAGFPFARTHPPVGRSLPHRPNIVSSPHHQMQRSDWVGFSRIYPDSAAPKVGQASSRSISRPQAPHGPSVPPR
jgi:hypothetical protein